MSDHTAPILSKEEVSVLLDAIEQAESDTVRTAHIFNLSVRAGLRACEIAQLTTGAHQRREGEE